MAVGLMVGNRFYTIGTGDFFNSFFSTIYINLEKSNWGTKYPITMNYLYRGELPYDLVKDGRLELENIRQELQYFPPSKVVWNFENLDENPPWGNDISPHIANLSNYFVTSEGDDLFEVMILAYNTSLQIKKDVIVKSFL